MRGGARPGAGRPAAEPTTRVVVRLTEERLAAYNDLGGPVWLQRVLGEHADSQKHPAKKPKTPKN